MTTIIERRSGWDSKVRREVRLTRGSIRNLADEVGVPNDDIGYENGQDMKVWSRLVNHFGSTKAIAEYIGVEIRE